MLLIIFAILTVQLVGDKKSISNKRQPKNGLNEAGLLEQCHRTIYYFRIRYWNGSVTIKEYEHSRMSDFYFNLDNVNIF